MTTVRPLGLLLLLVFGLSLALAHDGSPDLATVEPTMHQLVDLRTALFELEDIDTAIARGYAQFGDCMSSGQGGQAIHFTNGARIDDPALEANAPEVLLFEPRADGSLRLVGAEYLVFQQAWHDAGHAAAPALLGREFTLNTTLLDEPFYALHVWAWQYNPLGLFANWNPLIRCTAETAARN